MKESIYLQSHGMDLSLDGFSKEAKAIWKAEGNSVKDIKKLDMYLKPEENKCYFVINDTFNGKFDLTK